MFVPTVKCSSESLSEKPLCAQDVDTHAAQGAENNLWPNVQP